MHKHKEEMKHARLQLLYGFNTFLQSADNNSFICHERLNKSCLRNFLHDIHHANLTDFAVSIYLALHRFAILPLQERYFDFLS